MDKKKAIEILNCLDIKEIWYLYWKKPIVSPHISLDEMMEARDMAVKELSSEDGWIPVSDKLPAEVEPVNITWINRDPKPYYVEIKDTPFTATAVYCKGKWWWYSATCEDYLREYLQSPGDAVDNAIEILAWQPIPEPYKKGGAE